MSNAPLAHRVLVIQISPNSVFPEVSPYSRHRVRSPVHMAFQHERQSGTPKLHPTASQNVRNGQNSTWQAAELPPLCQYNANAGREETVACMRTIRTRPELGTSLTYWASASFQRLALWGLAPVPIGAYSSDRLEKRALLRDLVNMYVSHSRNRIIFCGNPW